LFNGSEELETSPPIYNGEDIVILNFLKYSFCKKKKRWEVQGSNLAPSQTASARNPESLG
jgi:hypothetical protein